MKILLIGYGKMGKLLEEKSIEQGHDIVGIINSTKIHELDQRWVDNVDCAIEFTSPSSVISNLKKCLKYKIPVVTGTTGWENEANDIISAYEQNNGALFYASNFSIGANILFRINQELARIMAKQKQYDLNITEIHHLNKKDSPSGTAISLANDIISNTDKTYWLNKSSNEPEALEITSKRIENVPGTHIVSYRNPIDEISIKHEAFNRDGFVNGAIKAAEFLYNRKGVYTMKDLLE